MKIVLSSLSYCRVSKDICSLQFLWWKTTHFPSTNSYRFFQWLIVISLVLYCISLNQSFWLAVTTHNVHFLCSDDLILNEKALVSLTIVWALPQMFEDAFSFLHYCRMGSSFNCPLSELRRWECYWANSLALIHTALKRRASFLVSFLYTFHSCFVVNI